MIIFNWLGYTAGGAEEKPDLPPEEIQVLKEYAGFGGIRVQRRESLDVERTLPSSELVQGIYEGLKNPGFEHGTILEPSMGVGGFFGNILWRR